MSPLLTSRFRHAVDLAMDIHGHQVRKGTAIPYFAHLMSVSALVLEAGGDEDAAIAGLLHDAVEDGNDGAALLERLRCEFGVAVAEIVEGCTDSVAIPGQRKPDWRARKEAYLERLKDHDETTLLVSACDKLHNARAIVADLRVIGDDLWSRFSRGREDQLWYYRSLVRVFEEHLQHPVTAELRRTVDLMGGVFPTCRQDALRGA